MKKPHLSWVVHKLGIPQNYKGGLHRQIGINHWLLN